jgi:hypothetical protein
MAKAKKQTKRKPKQTQEADSTFFLKLVLFLILGSQWVRIENLAEVWSVPLPIGLVIGLFFASHDHFQIDRKIEYALLLVAAFIAFWLPVGIFIQV